MITAAEIQTIRDNDPGAVLPGIDTMTGNPYATSSLLDVTKITQNSKAPYYYSPSANIVYVTQAGAVLSGINFGSATVILEANNVTIKDCTFSDTTGFWGVSQPSGVSGATVENCTFTGSKSPTEKKTSGSVPSGHNNRGQYLFEFASRYDRHSARRRDRKLHVGRGICNSGAWRRDLCSGYDRARHHHRQFH